jgi:fumarylacetoacetate (FAA) hydrolase
VIVDAVPMGTSAAEALRHIRLLVQINDWSLRALAVPEMKTGFGWIQAKPPARWPLRRHARRARRGLARWQGMPRLVVEWNGKPFGRANGREMAYGFHELVAHAAATRDLVAGTIIGSGTVANANYAESARAASPNGGRSRSLPTAGPRPRSCGLATAVECGR